MTVLHNIGIIWKETILFGKKRGKGFKKHPKNTGKLQDSLFPKATPHCYRLSV